MDGCKDKCPLKSFKTQALFRMRYILYILKKCALILAIIVMVLPLLFWLWKIILLAADNPTRAEPLFSSSLLFIPGTGLVVAGILWVIDAFQKMGAPCFCGGRQTFHRSFMKSYLARAKESFCKNAVVQCPCGEVRRAAVLGISEQSVLMRILQFDEDGKTRLTALQKITDQKAIEKAALEDTSSDVRLEATERIEDKAILSQILHSDRVERVRLTALRKITDQKAIEKAALEGDFAEVRLEAIERIEDEAILSQILHFDSDEKVRLTALRKITDQKAIEKAALESGFAEVRLEAIGRIKDEAVLLELALGEASDEVHRAAARRITTHEGLCKLMQSLVDVVRLAAACKITDEEWAVNTALHDPSKAVRIAAAKHCIAKYPLKLLRKSNVPEIWRMALCQVKEVAGGEVTFPTAIRALCLDRVKELGLSGKMVCPDCLTGSVSRHDITETVYSGNMTPEYEKVIGCEYTCSYCDARSGADFSVKIARTKGAVGDER